MRDLTQQAVNLWVSRKTGIPPERIETADLNYSQGYYYSELTNADTTFEVSYKLINEPGHHYINLLDEDEGMTPVAFLEQCLEIYDEIKRRVT